MQSLLFFATAYGSDFEIVIYSKFTKFVSQATISHQDLLQTFTRVLWSR